MRTKKQYIYFFNDSNEAYHNIKRSVLMKTLNEFRVPIKLIRLFNMMLRYTKGAIKTKDLVRMKFVNG